MPKEAKKEDVLSKKDEREKSDDSYIHIVMRRNEELRKAQVNKVRETKEKETPMGAVKTKHYDVCTYKGQKGRILATKRYLKGVTKRQDGRKSTVYNNGM